jgi:uncharacterized protein Smg (DUF494 family)
VSGRGGTEDVARLLRLLAEKLEDHLEGDELALETLGEAMEEGGYSAEELLSAILAIRCIAGGGEPGGWIAGAPGRHAARVLNTEERESLSTEAWGYLLDLRLQGTLDTEQFERVLEVLTASGIRPVSVEHARDVAARVALEHADGGNAGEAGHGDIELAH